MQVFLQHVFLTAAEELSFTTAAVRLNVSQPRISLMVRKLEESLGFALFHRTSRKVRLTSAGAQFLPAARAAWDAYNDARELARELARDNQVSLRLGAPYYTATMEARIAVQKAFLAARPNARLEVTGSMTPELVRMLRAGELDVLIAPRPIEDEAELESIIVARAHGLIGIPPDHPLHDRQQILPADLAGIEIVSLPRRVGLERFTAWYRYAIDAGARLVESPDMAQTAMAEMAIERNIPMLSLGFAGRMAPDPRLIWHVVEGTEDFIEIVAVRARDHRPSHVVQAFWDAAIAQGAELSKPGARLSREPSEA